MKIKLSKRDGLYIGAIGMTCAGVPGRITATAVGATKADALAKASQIAERIASDPVMRALVPPQAMAALKVTKGLASAARRGLPTLRRAWGFLSPKSKALAKSLAADIVPTPKVSDVGWNPFKRKRKKRSVRKPDRELENEGGADNSDEEGSDE